MDAAVPRGGSCARSLKVAGGLGIPRIADRRPSDGTRSHLRVATIGCKGENFLMPNFLVFHVVELFSVIHV